MFQSICSDCLLAFTVFKFTEDINRALRAASLIQLINHSKMSWRLGVLRFIDFNFFTNSMLNTVGMAILRTGTHKAEIMAIKSTILIWCKSFSKINFSNSILKTVDDKSPQRKIQGSNPDVKRNPYLVLIRHVLRFWKINGNQTSDEQNANVPIYDNQTSLALCIAWLRN